MRICVSGGCGFIGSNFIKSIIDKPEVERVINLDCLTYAGSLLNTESLESHDKYRFEKVDVRDKDGVTEVMSDYAVTHVVNMAAESHVDRSIAEPSDFLTTNFLGTFNMLQCFMDQCAGDYSGKRFLQVSTDEVYGSILRESFEEDSVLRPNSPYSASKASADLLVRSYHVTYGLPALITRCSNNYGPYQYPEKLVPVVIQAALEGRSIPVYGEGRNIRDWIHVSDHCTALWQVLTRGVIGDIYNIGASNERSNLDLVRELCQLVNPASVDLITFVPDRKGHDYRYSINWSKLYRETLWTPKHDGFKDTVDWYKANQDWVKKVAGHKVRA